MTIRLTFFLLIWPVVLSDSKQDQLIYLNSAVVSQPDQQSSREQVLSGNLMLIKINGSIKKQHREELSSRVFIVTYLPKNAFLVSLPGNAENRGTVLSELSKLPFIAWISPYEPEMKVDLSRVTQWISANELIREKTVKTGSAPVSSLQVLSLPGMEPKNFRSAGLKLENVHYIVKMGALSLYEIQINAADANQVIRKLMDMDSVVWMELKTPKILLNSKSIWVGQSGLDGGQTTPVFDHGINGQGTVVAFLDTGVDADSCYFYDQVEMLPDETLNTNQRKIIAYQDFGNQGNWDSQNHGTHVGGSIAGDSTPFGVHNSSDGMAPGAKLVVQDGGYAVDQFADMPFLPVDYYQDIFARAYDMGARIHSNSWGAHEDFGTNNYTIECQMCDQFMWDYPDFLILFAAGNSGHSGSPTISDPATAKNVIAVAATLPGASAGNLASFSSNGPIQDGRLKPDISAPGSSIISASNDGNIASFNCNTQSMSGTSMACPTAAGLSALILQYYQDGFYPSGSALPANEFVPSSALLKGTLLLSGQPMTGELEFPNTNQGWGRATLDDALYFDGDTETIQIVDQTTGLQTGQFHEFPVQVSQGDTLKVLLVWTDYPSTPIASINLVNDLNLTVSGPEGTFKGNVLSNGSSASGGAYDTINNVEMVLLKSAQQGTYTVRIDGLSVPEPSQPYALLFKTVPTPQIVEVLNESPVSLNYHEEILYSFSIPEEALSLSVITRGPNGDADLYVRHGANATTSLYDAVSASASSNESITIPNPESGDWTALVYAFSAFSDLEIVASYTVLPNPCPSLSSLLPLWPSPGVSVREIILAQSCLDSE